MHLEFVAEEKSQLIQQIIVVAKKKMKIQSKVS